MKYFFKNYFYAYFFQLFFLFFCLNQPLSESSIRIDPRTYVDFLKINHVRYFEQAIMAIEKRLSEIDNIAAKRNIGLKHVISYGYGSGFLKFCKIGNDLDYGTVIDLGTIPYNSTEPERSSEILINKIENYVTIEKELFYRKNSPELSGMFIDNTLNEVGILQHRHLIKKSLAHQLNDLVAGKKTNKIIRSKNVGYVPVNLDTNEVFIESSTMASYYSNQIRFSDEMLSGIREISVTHYFLFLLEITKDKKATSVMQCTLYPTFFPLGRVFYSRENLFLNVWINDQSYQTFFDRVISLTPDRYKELLHEYIGEFIMLARDEMIRGRKIKAMKRIHQAYDGLKPYLFQQQQKAIEDKLKEWLEGPASTIVETFVEESSILKSLLINPNIYRMYLKNGDVDKIFEFFSKSISVLSKQYRTDAFYQLKQIVDRLLKMDLKKLTAHDCDELKKSAEAFQNDILPPKEDFLNIIEILQNKLLEKGYLLVRIIGTAPTQFKVNIYDLKDFVNKVPDLNYLKKRGFHVFPNVEYHLTLKKEIDPNLYSKTYWLAPEMPINAFSK